MDRRKFIKRAGISVLAMSIGGKIQSAESKDFSHIQSETNNNSKIMKHKCKITILKRECYKDLQENYLADPKSGPCPYSREEQVIMVDSDNFFRMLNGTYSSYIGFSYDLQSEVA